MAYIGNSLAQGLVSGANIQDGTIDTPDLKASAVTLPKMDFSAGTANGVGYLNGSKAFTTGNALTFDGTNLIGTGRFQSQLIRIKSPAYSEIYFSTTDSAGNGAISYEHSVDTLKFYTNTTERLRIASAGQFGLGGGANYGTTGQVLTSQGANAAPIWSTVSGGGGTTTNALTIGTGLTGTSFNGSSAVTVGLATSGASAGTYGNSYSSGSYIYLPQITVDIYGRITNISQNYVSLGGGGGGYSFANIYVNGNPGATASSSSDTLNFVGSGATTVSYSSGAYKTITISSTAGAGGGSTGWYSMITTIGGITGLPVPTEYDGTMTNMASTKLFVGGEDSSYISGNQPSSGQWSSNSGSGTFSIYTNMDYSPGYSGSTININTSSGGVRFALAPKWSSSTNGSSNYYGSSYSGSSFGYYQGWMAAPSGTNRTWYGIVVVDQSGVTATAVNCTIHETKSSQYKTYFAISMTDAQVSTLYSTMGNICTFSTYVTMRAYSYYTYSM
jgi:hypothetical protein